MPDAGPRSAVDSAYDSRARCPGFDIWFSHMLLILLPLIQEGQRKYAHEVLVTRLGGQSLPGKSVVRLTDQPDMTIAVYRGRKTKLLRQQ